MAKPRRVKSIYALCRETLGIVDVDQHDFLCGMAALTDWLDAHSGLLTEELSELLDMLKAAGKLRATKAFFEPMQFFVDNVPIDVRRAIFTNPGYLEAYEYAVKIMPPVPTFN